MKKVIIIGGGPAGLTAGIELLRNSSEYEVTILEASSRLGGISCTVEHNGNFMDIGGHRFFSKSMDVNKWWNDILPNGEMLTRKRVSRIYFNKRFYGYPLKINYKTLKNMEFKVLWISAFDYLRAKVKKLPEDSLENFYINRFGKNLYEMFFKDYTEKVWGLPPSEISASWGSQRVKALSLSTAVADYIRKLLGKSADETSLIEEFKYPKYGPGQLWNTVSEKFLQLGGKIVKNAMVNTVEMGNFPRVKYVKGGKVYEEKGNIVLSSMSVCDLINSMENVPDDIKEIGLNLPYRDFVTAGVLLNKKCELEDCWIYVQDKNVSLGRIQIFNNWSPYLVTDKDKTWLGLEYFCNENDSMWNMTEKEFAEMAKSDLVKVGFITEKEIISDFHIEKVKKAYPAYFGTYSQMGKVRDYIDGFENLYCIGRNGQHRYNNMDHSMMTAFEAVKNIISSKETKENVWNVNTEEGYHEEKCKN